MDTKDFFKEHVLCFESKADGLHPIDAEPVTEQTETTEEETDCEEEETEESQDSEPTPQEIESKQEDVLMQYLTALATTDTQIAEGLKNPKKNQTKMYAYIKSQAQKQQKNGMAMIKDDVVYGWAIHYWTEEIPSDNEQKKAPKPTATPKPTTTAAPIKVTPTEPVTPKKLTSIRDRYKHSRKAVEDTPSLF